MNQRFTFLYLLYYPAELPDAIYTERHIVSYDPRVERISTQLQMCAIQP